ncbi:ABC transporter permease [Crassaminicella profunda]|uniref:ABC transporter permease n=1 Tax=Crassaminicella profunda TaxID=1286698 RepID=UPI001CA676FE|nr:ribose ABC transporter permease [Crassaminicella profunda]QZY54934.1 ribose ABC transporter permease [Crassaminicella profunda]
MEKKIKSIFFKYGILVFLIFLCIVFSIASPYFLTIDNITIVLRQISIVGICTVGMTMIILTAGIDLSVGAMMALCSVILAKLMVAGVNIFLAIMITLLVGMILGLFNGFLINKIKISPLISTLGTMTIYRGITYIITKGLPVFGFPKSFSFIGQGYLGMVPIPVIILILVYIAGFFILYFTKLGRYIYGIGGNEKASILSGIHVKKVKYMVYVMAGFLTALASIVMLSRINSALPNAGTGFELDVVTAVVLGGISVNGGEGKLAGVIIGSLIMGILSNGMILLNIGEYYQIVVKGIVLLTAVGIDNAVKR